MDLQVLQINRFPWDWDVALDGVPLGGDRDYLAAKLSDGGLPAAAAADIDADGLRYFVYSLVEGGPDTNFDRESVTADQLRKVLQDVENAVFLTVAGAPNGLDDLRNAGTALAMTLLPAWLIDRLFNMPRGTPLVVRVDDFAACVPWELCYSPQHGTFLCAHLSMSRGMTVRVSDRGLATHHVSGPDPISLPEVSCIVNPEEDPDLGPCARMLEDLAFDLQKRGAGGFRILAGVPKRRLLAAIGKPCFHYTGHIHFDPDLGSYIQCSDQSRFDVREAKDALCKGLVPKLALLNGCGSDATGRGEPRTERSATQTSFVREFYKNKVWAVIGTRWEVDLATAQAANSHFHEAFAGDAKPIGELMRQFRSSQATGWPCYVLYGDPRIRFAFPRGGTPSSRSRPAFSDDIRLAVPATAISLDQEGGVRRPGLLTPQYVTILLENSEYTRECPAILQSFECFLRAVVTRAHALNAVLAPNTQSLACAIRVEGYPAPLRGAPEGFTLPDINLQWAECFGMASPWSMRGHRLGRVLKNALSEVREVIARAKELPLPAPVVVICVASDPARADRGGPRDSSDAIRLCEDLRRLTLPALDTRARFAETTAKTVVLGFGDGAPSSFLRALAGTSTDGLWRYVRDADEARRFADRLCDSLLDPQSPDSFDRLSRGDESTAAQ